MQNLQSPNFELAGGRWHITKIKQKKTKQNKNKQTNK